MYTATLDKLCVAFTFNTLASVAPSVYTVFTEDADSSTTVSAAQNADGPLHGTGVDPRASAAWIGVPGPSTSVLTVAPRKHMS